MRFILLILLFVLQCNLLLFAQNTEKLYLRYDHDCMDRYLYRITDGNDLISKGIQSIAYQITQNPTQRITLEVGEENGQFNGSIQGIVRRCGEISMDENFVNRINKGELQVFLVRDGSQGFSASPVLSASFFIKRYDVLNYVTSEFSTNQLTEFLANNNKDLALPNSSAQLFYLDNSAFNCKKTFALQKVPNNNAKPFSEIIFSPDLGVLQERATFRKDDPNAKMKILESINNIPLNEYLDAVCSGRTLLELEKRYFTSFYTYELPITEIVYLNADGTRTSHYVDGSSSSSSSISTSNSSSSYVSSDASSGSYTSSTDVTTTGANASRKVASSGTKKAKASSPKVVERIVEKPVIVEKIVEKPVYIEKIVEKPVYVEKIVEKPVPSYPSVAVASTTFTEKGGSETTYTVQAGETLYSIARKTNVSIANLKAWNHLEGDVIEVGEVLTLIAPAAFKTKTVEKSEKTTVSTEKTTTTAKISHPKVAASKEVFTPKGTDEAVPTPAAWKDTKIVYHTVKEGETVVSIAKKYGYTVDRFMDVSGLKSDKIAKGQKIRINDCACTPTDEATKAKTTNDSKEILVSKGAPTTKAIHNKTKHTLHIVGKDETLFSIAKKYKTSVEKLRTLNGFDKAEIVIPSQKIMID